MDSEITSCSLFWSLYSSIWIASGLWSFRMLPSRDLGRSQLSGVPTFLLEFHRCGISVPSRAASKFPDYSFPNRNLAIHLLSFSSCFKYAACSSDIRSLYLGLYVELRILSLLCCNWTSLCIWSIALTTLNSWLLIFSTDIGDYYIRNTFVVASPTYS